MREAELMRYSVKCSMAKHAAIIKAAARAGLSVTQFVQAHFETILDERRAAAAGKVPEPEAAEENLPGDLARARKAGLTLAEFQLHREMCRRMDAKRFYADGAAAIGNPLGMDDMVVRPIMYRMMKKGVISKVYDGNGVHVMGVWRVHELTDVAS